MTAEKKDTKKEEGQEKAKSQAPGSAPAEAKTASAAETASSSEGQASAQPQQSHGREGREGGRGEGRGKGGKRPFVRKKDTTASEFIEKVIAINRVTKVTKGGKRLAFSALVVVGDAKGRVGYSLQKAGEVAYAIKKSLTAAKRAMIRVPLSESTIPHEIIGICGASQVMLKPASEGTGVIAAGPVRAVCDSVGIRNILTKCHRSNNPINVVKATMDGLSRLKARKLETTTVAPAAAAAPAGEAQNAA